MNNLKIDCIIAIDAGANGGIAVYHHDRVTSVKMPKDIKQIAEYIEYWKGISQPIVFLEKINVRPDDASIGPDGNINMGKIYRIQKMVANFESLKTTIHLCNVPYILVYPMKWQSGLRLRVKGEEKADRKRRYKDVAQRLYPTQKMTLWNADAFLILHFARHVLAADIKWVLAQLPEAEKQKLF